MGLPPLLPFLSASGQIQRVAYLLALTRADKRALFREICQIAGCCGGRSAGDHAVLSPADDSARAKEKLRFRSSHPGTAQCEILPIRALPVPCHER